MTRPQPERERAATDAQASGPGEPLREAVIEVLRTIYDPEIPVDIWELGLVYAVETNAEGAVDIRMTLTSPACPVAESLPPEVERKASEIPGVKQARVEIVWDPPWDPSMMTDAARLELGFL